MQDETAPSRKTAKALEMRVKRRKKENLVFFFAVTASPLLREAGTEQICQTLRASTAVNMYVASDEGVCEWYFWVFRKKKVVGDLFERQHVSAGHFDKEEGVGKDGTSKSVPTIEQALLPSHEITHVNECIADGWSPAKMQ